ESVGGDDSFIADLIETYLGDAATQIAAIRSAIEDGDAEALVRPAHTLKSASLTVGAIRLGELCRSIEQRARAGEAAGLDGEAAAVADEWRSADEALRGWLAERGSTP
ncbi:MAG TPA: Hpt domain-containing protein, partial [Candidatus Limnocylindrales bacterium]